MTRDTSARETPASRATSSIVTYERRPLPAEEDRLPELEPSRATLGSMALERSKKYLRSNPRRVYGRAVRALQCFGAPGDGERRVEQALPAHRIAGAPISWGVCEVPGWGHQLPSSRGFAEM